MILKLILVFDCRWSPVHVYIIVLIFVFLSSNILGFSVTFYCKFLFQGYPLVKPPVLILLFIHQKRLNNCHVCSGHSKHLRCKSSSLVNKICIYHRNILFKLLKQYLELHFDKSGLFLAPKSHPSTAPEFLLK